MTTAAALRRVLSREIETLRVQLRAYPRETMIWEIPPGFANSAGTLTLHLAGNLQHFIGAVLGGSTYVRDREREFSARGLSRDDLMVQLAAADAALELGLADLSETRLEALYPVEFAGNTLPTGTVLLQLVAHFGYHLGQVDVHRRLVTGNNKAIEGPPAAMLKEQAP